MPGERLAGYSNDCTSRQVKSLRVRILHVLDHSLPLQSGYVYRTLGIVNEQRALGWEPVLITSGKHHAPGPKREWIAGWQFLRTLPPSGLGSKISGLRDLKIVADLSRQLQEVIDEFDPHIIHAHSPVLNALAAMRVSRRRRLPLVYEVRAFWEDARISMGDRKQPGLRYAVTKQLETYALRQADAVVTICEGLARDIVARGIPPEKVTIVPNAVDRNTFGLSRMTPTRDLAQRLGLAGKTVLGFFGSFYFYEGLHILLEALPELKRARPDIALLLVGGGPEEARLREGAARLGLEESVVFGGRVAHEEISDYYEIVKLLVFPRISMRLTELVTPLKPLEAMAQERIVVASDVGGHRELIEDNETGYLFAPGSPRKLAERVLRALADEASWPRIRARAIEFIETRRSWRSCVAGYDEAYSRVLAKYEKRIPPLSKNRGVAHCD